jgi:mannose-1-phosphate guanylyltransferase
MFVWRVARFLSEVERQLPALHAVLEQSATAPGQLAAAWVGAPDVTLDYGIMEGAPDVAVIPAGGLRWNDIGSWEALLEVLPTDPSGNVVVGPEHLGLDTARTLVHAGQKRLVATLGVADLVIVDTGDVLFVCTRNQAQNVKAVVTALKQRPDGKDFL